MKTKKLKKSKEKVKSTEELLTRPLDVPLGTIIQDHNGIIGNFKPDSDWEEYFTSPTGIKFIMRTQKDGVKINIK